MVVDRGWRVAAVASTCAIIGSPATWCNTLGCADFMRVPLPAARMTIWRSDIVSVCFAAVRPWTTASQLSLIGSQRAGAGGGGRKERGGRDPAPPPKGWALRG